MIRTISALLLSLSLSFPAFADAENDFFQPLMGDLQAEIPQAQQESKGFLVMYHMDECPFCDRMKRTVLNNKDVQDFYRKNFFIYQINIKSSNPLVDFSGKETTEKDFAIDQRFRLTPSFAFYDTTGKLIFKNIGTVKDEKEFILLGRYILDQTYKTTPWLVFKKNVASS